MTIEALQTETNNLLRQLLNAVTQGAVGTPAPVATPAADVQPAAAQPVKRGRGRPVQGETPPAQPTQPAPVAGSPTVSDPLDFLNTAAPAEPEKPKATIEAVRDALVKYQVRANSPEKARQILKNVGGSDTLVSLPEDKWQAVIDAANKA